MSALHPNLARIAAQYDEIVAAFRSGRVSAAQANARITALAARDDAGVEWSIDPVDGSWCYRTLDGRLVVADPPTWGLASATPSDLGSAGRRDPDARVEFHEVDESRFVGSLHGSTRRERLDDEGSRSGPKRVVWGLAALAVGAAALVTLLR